MRQLILCCWYLALSSCLFSLPIEPATQKIAIVEFGKLDPVNIQDLIDRLPNPTQASKPIAPMNSWNGVFMASSQRHWDFNYEPVPIPVYAQVASSMERFVKFAASQVERLEATLPTSHRHPVVRQASFRKRRVAPVAFSLSESASMLSVETQILWQEIEAAMLEAASQAQEPVDWVGRWFTSRFCPLY